MSAKFRPTMKDRKKEMRRKARSYIQSLVVQGKTTATREVINYFQTIGYDRFFQQQLTLKGLRQDISAFFQEFAGIRAAGRGAPPIASTIANKQDVKNMEDDGCNIVPGALIRKDMLNMTTPQLRQTTLKLAKMGLAYIESTAYGFVLYKRNSGRQLPLPFEIPEGVLQDAEALVSADIARRAAEN